MNDDFKKHIRGSFYTALYSVSINLKGIILIPVLTRTLDLSVYGTFVLAQTIISLFGGISNLSLGAALSRFFPSVRGTENGRTVFYSLFWASLTSNVAFVLLLLAVADPVASYLSLSHTNMIQLAFIVMVHSMYGFLLEYYRASDLFGTFLFVAGFQGYAEIGAVVIAALFSHQLTVILASVLIVNILFLVGLSLSVLPRVGKPAPEISNLRKYLRFSLPIIPSTMSDWIINLSDRLLIGLILGNAAVGIYNPGYALGAVVLFVPGIFITSLPPLMARLHDTGQSHTFEEIIGFSTKYFLVLGIPVLFGSFVLSKPLLTLLANKDIAAQGYFITPIVVLGALFLGSARILAHVLQVHLQTWPIAKAWLLSAAVNLILNMLTLPAFGIVAAAGSTTVSFGLAFLLTWYFTRRASEFRMPELRLMRIAVCSALMAFLVFVVQRFLIENVLVDLAIGIAIYLLLLFVLRVFGDHEKELFASFFPRIARVAGV